MSELPLKGIRVLDLGRIYAGPTAGKILGDMGAQVIKVESIQRIDLPNRKLCYPENQPGDDAYNRGGWFHWLNSNKQSITLDLTKPKGVEILKELVKLSDVILENFSPRVMKHFGLDYEVLKEIKPDIIMVSLCGFGETGPHCERPAYAWAFEGAAGLESLTGYPGGSPMIVGTGYGDWVLGMNGVAAILLGLLHRRKTGKGKYINIAGQEVVMHQLGDVLLETAMTGKIRKRIGNGHDFAAPHGCYQCKGADDWIAIAIRTDSEWESFCAATGNPQWKDDERFRNIEGRRKNQADLDKLIEAWTMQFEHQEAMHLLQKAGVAAGAVLSPKEALFNDNFRERGFFQLINQPGAGRRPMPKLLGAKFSAFKTREESAPLLGEHNHQVLKDLLHMSQEEIEALQKEEIIGTVPIGHGQLKDRGFNIPFMTKKDSAAFDPDYLEQLRKLYPE